MHPPPIPSNVRFTHRYRFLSTDDEEPTAKAVASSDLCHVPGCVVGVINDLGYNIAASVKVLVVEIWTPCAAVGNPATCEILWHTTGEIATIEVSDTTLSTARPAHVRSVPPPRSLAGFWLDPSAGNAVDVVSITAPLNSVIDVVLSVVLMDTGGVAQTYSIAAGAIGRLFYTPLDGSTDVFPPIGLNWTT